MWGQEFIAPTMLEGTNSYRSNFLQCDLESGDGIFFEADGLIWIGWKGF